MFKRQVSGRKLKCATKRRRAKPKRTARRQLDGAFNFATRVLSDFDPTTGVKGEIRDRMVRTAEGRFYLIEGPDIKPGAREVVTPYRLEDVFAWLQDCPEQIERTVIVGNANCNLLER